MTWQRDSHNLFDYESRNIVHESLNVEDSCTLIYSNNQVKVLEDCEESCKVLARIEKVNQNPDCPSFIVKPAEEEQMWLIARHQYLNDEMSGYVLQQGDIIKLGRVKYRVLEMSNDQSTIDVRESNAITDLDQAACRICLYETQTDDNPLVSPCECSGSMQTIHLRCLQQWINSRIEKRTNNNVQILQWPNMDCEICKTSFPFRIQHNDQLYECFETKQENQPYLVLEAISQDRHKRRGIFALYYNNNTQAQLGRSHDSDVRIADISVSRAHALIIHIDGQFILKDNHSKFGTLVLAKNDIILGEETLALQLGRTVLHIKAANNYSPNKQLYSEGFLDQDDTQTPDFSL